jgi:undecaprenyl pyrophosphate synthase
MNDVTAHQPTTHLPKHIAIIMDGDGHYGRSNTAKCAMLGIAPVSKTSARLFALPPTLVCRT